MGAGACTGGDAAVGPSPVVPLSQVAEDIGSLMEWKLLGLIVPMSR